MLPLRRPHPLPAPAAQGIVLLALMLMLMLGAIAATSAVDVWATTRKHEQERELLWVGAQYRQAIRHYYFTAPAGKGRMLPAKLEDLLADDRFPLPMRHLRRLYPDPVTGGNEWGLVMLGDRITGVYSLSEAAPLKQTGFAAADAAFETKTSYRDWIFRFTPPRTARR
jgi:type II secretory pathway pseudopilin PulG